MGLYVTHDCFRGGYSRFHHFRQCVAKVVGVPLLLMEGFFDREEWMVCAGETLAHKKLMENRLESLPVSWKAWEDDPIALFLHHSDCDGEISWEDAVPIAERLEQIAPHIEWDGRDDWDFRAHALQFAAGLRRAAELRENVEFC